jgi:uncharacterized protein DUF2834
LPYYFLFQFISVYGLNVSLLLQDLFANSSSSFFAMDVIVSSIVFWAYLYPRRLQLKNVWLYVVANLAVGLSFALPLFLYFRQSKIEQVNQSRTT